ncbi:MAG TPA: amidohydrolase family protein [Gemmatimonadaceae bacterium]|nr:amidohydrolase family protein [Gemmatimonadaceae bacterium]
MRRLMLAGILVARAALCQGAAAGRADRAGDVAPDLALVGGRVYQSAASQPIENGVVLVRNGRITAVGPADRVRVPSGAVIVDATGGVVAAGFWNSHVHMLKPGLFGADTLPAAEIASQLEEMLTRWGFTTVFDVASSLDNTNAIRRRIASGDVRGPKILTVGEPFYPNGGTPIYVRQFFRDNHLPTAEVGTLDEAVARAQRQLHNGADGVKLFAGAIVGGAVGVLPMPVVVATALAAEAHRAGKPVFAHPSNTQGLDVAIRSGVDVLAHTTPMSGPWPPALVQQLIAHHLALVPTLSLFRVEAAKFGQSAADAASDMDAAVQQLNAFSRAGGEVLFGTDVGYTDAFDTTEEYQLMARALDYRQILASLTTNPAARFGFALTKGRIAKNFDADLVVLGADPEKDVTAFARVRYTIRDGKVIYRAAPARQNSGLTGPLEAGIR